MEKDKQDIIDDLESKLDWYRMAMVVMICALAVMIAGCM